MYVVRMDGERMVQKLLEGESEGESKRGRPRLGQMGVVKREKWARKSGEQELWINWNGNLS